GDSVFINPKKQGKFTLSVECLNEKVECDFEFVQLPILLEGGPNGYLTSKELVEILGFPDSKKEVVVTKTYRLTDGFKHEDEGYYEHWRYDKYPKLIISLHRGHNMVSGIYTEAGQNQAVFKDVEKAISPPLPDTTSTKQHEAWINSHFGITRYITRKIGDAEVILGFNTSLVYVPESIPELISASSGIDDGLDFKLGYRDSNGAFQDAVGNHIKLGDKTVHVPFQSSNKDVAEVYEDGSCGLRGMGSCWVGVKIPDQEPLAITVETKQVPVTLDFSFDGSGSTAKSVVKTLGLPDERDENYKEGSGFVERWKYEKYPGLVLTFSGDSLREIISNPVGNSSYQETKRLPPENTEALRIKKESDIADLLAKGDYEAALKLDPTNEPALAKKAASSLKNAIENGDYEAALKLDPANEQALRMKTLKSALDRGDFKAALKIDPSNKKALSMKTAAYAELLKSNVLIIPEVYSLAYSPDGRDIAVISKDHRLLILDSKTGLEKTRFLGAIKKDIARVAFSPDGKNILTESENGEPKIWDLEKKRLSKTLKNTSHAAYSPDGNRIVTSTVITKDESTINILDAKTFKEESTCKLNGVVGSVAFSPDGESIIFESISVDSLLKTRTNNFHALNAETLTEKFTLSESKEDIISIAYGPDGNSIATSSNIVFAYRNSLKIWDAQSGEEKNEVELPLGRVFFSPDGESIILASQIIELEKENSPSSGMGIRDKPEQNNFIKILDAKTGQENASFKIALPEVEKNTAIDVSLSPDGNSIAVGTRVVEEGGGARGGGIF
ncbi:hypothetical protein N9009_01960, partial [bacterium]|nr:hypothetical protein [bacterium]